MGAAHSNDLRLRVVAEVAGGTSRRGAAARFKVGVSSAIRWVELAALTGGVAPRARGGKSRSPLEAHAAWLLALNAAEPDLTLEAIMRRVGEDRGLTTSEISIRRFFKRHRITYKKKRCTPPNRIGRTWLGRVSGGSPAKAASTPRSWCSSTKPAPTPR